MRDSTGWPNGNSPGRGRRERETGVVFSGKTSLNPLWRIHRTLGRVGAGGEPHDGGGSHPVRDFHAETGRWSGRGPAGPEGSRSARDPRSQRRNTPVARTVGRAAVERSG